MQSVTTTLLQTKLYAPEIQSDFVVRPHLIEKLESGTQRKLTVVTAPAGFGKTTLVMQWLSHIDHSISWLSLDENDNDMTRFLSYFVAAIQQSDPQIGHTLQELIRSPQSIPIETMLTTLINDLAQSDVSLILVLDDYHVIDAEPILEALIFLLTHMTTKQPKHLEFPSTIELIPHPVG